MPAGGVRLTADAEALALAPRGRTGGYLVASCQGDNAYALYRLSDLANAGRLRINGGGIDGTSDTDGIDPVPAIPAPPTRTRCWSRRTATARRRPRTSDT